MYEASIALRRGEIRPVYAQAIAAAGDTLTIQPAPTAPFTAPTFTLLDSLGRAVSGFNGVAIGAGNYQGGALAAPLLWYVLNMGGLDAGAYVARFVFAVRSTQDGLTRELVCEVGISLLAGVEVGATYDLNTPSGQVRLYCLDTDTANALFSDAEIGQFLTDGGGIPALGASLALEALAVDRARLATALKVGTFGSSPATVYQALTERAQRLRALACAPPIASAPLPVFVAAEDAPW